MYNGDIIYKDMKSKHLIAGLWLMLCLSCEKDPEQHSVPPPSAGPLRGVFIVNEGAFGQGNGSVSYKSSSSGYFAPDLFYTVNNAYLGDVIQSMFIYNERGYIVVNNSQKVEVVSMSGFNSVATITGFSSPRYFIATQSTGYVTDWISNSVKVVSLATNSVTGSIAVGNGPEQMAIANGKLYVVNSGGFVMDSTVSIIDLNSNTVIKTLTVGINPNSLQQDAQGKIVVICGGSTGQDFIGGTADDLAGSAAEIDPVADSVTASFVLGQYVHPLKLSSSNGGTGLYFLHGENAYTGTVYLYNGNASSEVIAQQFYGLGVHPETGQLYAARPGFSASAYVLRYNSDGTLVDSLLAGIGPNGFAFN
jgi:YVTN family beta-propeller protein